jgi:class 3 adenylate cyclase
LHGLIVGAHRGSGDYRSTLTPRQGRATLAAMGRIAHRNLDAPHEVLEFPRLRVNLVRVGSLTIGRGIVEPGFRWSTHVRTEAEESFCQVHHLQMLLSGRFAVEMADGEHVEIEPGEVFDVPPGHDAWVVGDEPAVLLDFLGNIDQLGRPTSSDRIVTTLVMTDIVDSTATASRFGDNTWKQLLAEHNRLVRSRLERYLGTEVNTTGDGFLAMFASARGAIRCAMSIRDATAGIGLPVRIGVHTGEIELLPGDIGGVAVHAAARVMALGGASDIMVSSSTRSLIDDDALHFESKGEQELKGLANSLGVFVLLD